MPDIGCTIKRLPPPMIAVAAQEAVRINPVNMPRLGLFLAPNKPPSPEEITFLVGSYWGPAGVNLTVGFLDNPEQTLRTRLIGHMNAWSKLANVKFTESKTDPQVRIARSPGDGYWSYLGTDILHVAANEATMNLDSFTMQTPESEFLRVVRHETGHTLGARHEHTRKEIVDLIDPAKAILYFRRTQGWSAAEVRAQVLTPIEDASILIGTPHAEDDSIMCYMLPGSIMKNGKPVIGGKDITADDYAIMGLIYPKVLV